MGRPHARRARSDTQARLDEEAQLRAQVQDLDAAAPDDVRRAATETYHETYADLTVQGEAPLSAMIAALRARLDVLAGGRPAECPAEAQAPA
ncbi:MAG: hypothetical protein M5R40_29605 [Anaerolineae bacterium]|nr:hypothetical protein [Anaerolineae bacterium]